MVANKFPYHFQIGRAFATFYLLCTQKQIPLQEFFHYLEIRHLNTSLYFPQTHQPHLLKGFAVTLPDVRVWSQTSTNQLLLPILPAAPLYEQMGHCATQFTLEDWNIVQDNLRKCTNSLAIRETTFSSNDQVVLPPINSTLSFMEPQDCVFMVVHL